MQGFLGGGSRAFIDFWKFVGIIFIAVLIMNGVQVSSLWEIPTRRMLGQYTRTKCVWESHVYHCASEEIVTGLGSPY